MKTLLLAAVLAAASVPALANQPRPQAPARQAPAASRVPVVVASMQPASLPDPAPAEAAQAGPRKVRVILPSPYRTE